MKKHSILIAIGAVLFVVGITLAVFNKKDKNNYYYIEKDMTKEEASALVLEKTKNVIELYENIDSSFNVVKEEPKEEDKEDNPYIKVSNYDDVVSALYTENGIKELETVKFNKQLFVNKKEDGIYLLKNIPDENKYATSSIVISDIKIDDNKEVNAKVTFSSDGLDKENDLTYYLYEKKVKLIKDDNNWLVDSFIYSNVKGA